MDPSVGASFIPKKPLAEVGGSRNGTVGLLFLLALLIFIASLVAAAGAFLYGRYLNISLDAKKASLAKYEEAYQLDTIKTLLRLDSRITQAYGVLQNHLAPSAIFEFLSQQTLEKVRFSNFSYVFSPNDRIAKITLSGETDSFATVALQSDQLGSNQALRDVVFSGIATDDKGGVTFEVAATVDTNMILYRNNLGASQTIPTQ